MSKFKVGDTVKYVRIHGFGSVPDGFIGKVVELEKNGDPVVLWENGNQSAHNQDYVHVISSVEDNPTIDAHYTKYPIQPMEFSLANNLDAAQHTVIKYTVRYRDKGGIRDLRAAIRVLELMIEREEKAQANG